MSHQNIFLCIVHWLPTVSSPYTISNHCIANGIDFAPNASAIKSAWNMQRQCDFAHTIRWLSGAVLPNYH
jgi:hypothetical protein